MDNRLCNTVHAIVGITYGNSGLVRGEAGRGVYSAYAHTPACVPGEELGRTPGRSGNRRSALRSPSLRSPCNREHTL